MNTFVCGQILKSNTILARSYSTHIPDQSRAIDRKPSLYKSDFIVATVYFLCFESGYCINDLQKNGWKTQYWFQVEIKR